MDKNFKNGCVLVIGGTGGVGSECVRTIHNHGARVVFTYNSNKDEATKIVDELNGKVSAIQLDLSNENSVKTSLSKINESNQGINTIINAAGFNIPQKYISEISQSESLLLKELNRYTNSKVILPRMLSGHVQGRFLSMISKLVNPKIIVEVGTYTGYSCLCLAEGLKKNGKIITIEKDEEFASIAKKFFSTEKSLRAGPTQEKKK